MVVKTFRGRTVREAIEKAKQALGDDARLIGTERDAAGVRVVAARERHARRAPQLPGTGARPQVGPAALPAGAERLLEELRERGVSTVLATRIARAAAHNLDPDHLDDPVRSREYARALFATWLPRRAGPGGDPQADADTIVLVGAPGAGKTTTAAKLAARIHLGEDRPVALASCDRRRLSGADELARYARLLDVEFHLVASRADLARARASAGPGGTLIIDTPGIPRRDERALEELSDLLAEIPPDKIELLLAADADAEALAGTLARFARLRPGSVGATRVDEAVRGGVVLTAVARSGLPLRHVAFGPDVPDDLSDGDPAWLAAWALTDGVRFQEIGR